MAPLFAGGGGVLIDCFTDDFNFEGIHAFCFCLECMIKAVNFCTGESLEDALRQLYLIDAIDDDGQITNIGRAMSGIFFNFLSTNGSSLPQFIWD
jgi:hypothetical protein